jgi:hypothetical protein
LRIHCGPNGLKSMAPRRVNDGHQQEQMNPLNLSGPKAKKGETSMKSFLGKVGVVFVIVLCTFVCTEAWAENWKSFASTPSGSFYYDFDSITLVSKNVIKVWTQQVFSLEGIDRMVEAFGPKFNDLHHQAVQFEIDCAESKVRMAYFNYSRDGKIITSGQYKKGEWEFFAPESVLSMLSQNLCGLLTEGQFKKF